MSLLLLFTQCSDDTAQTTSTSPKTEEELQATFSSIQTQVLAKSCALSGCHVTGGQSPAMEASMAYSNLVDQLSSGAAGMKYVTPFKPEDSYLIHKLEGTQDSVGGAGAQMPRGKNPLSAATLTKIKEWITRGAENN